MFVKMADDQFIKDNQYLVIAPTLHCRYTRATENTIVGERSVGDARLNYDEQIYAWFDFHLKEEQQLLRMKPQEYSTIQWVKTYGKPQTHGLLRTQKLKRYTSTVTEAQIPASEMVF